MWKIILNLSCVLFVGFVYFECDHTGRLFQDFFVNAGRGNVWGVFIWTPFALLIYGILILYLKRSDKYRKRSGKIFGKVEGNPVVIAKTKDLFKTKKMRTKPKGTRKRNREKSKDIKK